MARGNRSWMYPSSKKGRFLPEFMEWITSFIHFAIGDANLGEYSEMKCPCAECNNCRSSNPNVLAVHLINYGFVPNYHIWYYHGESFPFDDAGTSSSGGHDHDVTGSDENDFPQPGPINPFDQMVRDAMGDPGQYNNWRTVNNTKLYHGVDDNDDDVPDYEEHPNASAQAYLNMLSIANIPMTGGRNVTLLQHVAEMLHGKTKHNISQEEFNYFLEMDRSSMNKEDA